MQLMAELLGTYLIMFDGFAVMVVNKNMGLLGIAVLWGLDVMIMIYTVGHVSGAHFNPAITIAFATSKRIAWRQVSFSINLSYNRHEQERINTIKKCFRDVSVHFLGYFCFQVPAYILSQVVGATLATSTVNLMFKEEQPQFLGTIPAGSDLQSLGLEFLITFHLMIAVAGIATDNRAVSTTAFLAS
ncbi:PREDICTED: aquaporin NIP1-1-like [Nicotiana attenuata]|uniref:Aquaporin nip1-1 n=1 Tax=Nicotiana attenuata TaxID=49451 RepID=A0A1J6JUG5_NICAT|nr:PREDICTED: aquaporin NIP1-1-like [Nicotiana attenuata]OIT21362.1 aquaporin nip1-1 [Nicotiana attenuata]